MLMYQSKHFETFSTLHTVNQNFPSHLHRCFELIFVVDGEMEVVINKRCLHLKTGQFLLILPYEIHSIITESQSQAKICIFSPDCVPTFRIMIENSYLENPIFDLSSETKTLISRTLFKDNPHLLEQKAGLYLLLSELLEQTTLIKVEKKDSELIPSILSYIQEHFTEAISLKSIASTLGYSYNYLSKYFNKNIGTSFVDFLNGIRINYACYLLSNTEKNITEIAYLCGYENTRSFNRNFVKIKLCAPKKYREKDSDVKALDRVIESTLTFQ
ncbi:helix-turn-helix domain-containing protein [Priestia megaterium]|uniref:helix-turn-helix domain-containing protein n=1 Tax=Priestia megaterium TaxID=1404 RepID=UPI00272F46C1|nr:helix-turn-helix domain-containing protein [Priestia megaterium]MDP1442123.1 helix-turn-helix domain-containing protein [Priestia megaterium]MDP1471100.1 helix-turn-helix domain-containing protein [Priestia megaterium]